MSILNSEEYVRHLLDKFWDNAARQTYFTHPTRVQAAIPTRLKAAGAHAFGFKGTVNRLHHIK